MKNISIILNVVLLIAVAVLYYLHFKGGSENTPAEGSAGSFMPISTSGIVFVNSDSLLEEYEYYKNKKVDFESAQERIKTELKNEGEKLQREIEEYQRQAIGMTDMEKAQKEEQLGMKQQRIMQRKEELLTQLDEDQAKSSDELYVKLNTFLREYNKSKNYSFVLGFQKGGGILFANDSLNITKDVVKGLNAEYVK